MSLKCAYAECGKYIMQRDPRLKCLQCDNVIHVKCTKSMQETNATQKSIVEAILGKPEHMAFVCRDHDSFDFMSYKAVLEEMKELKEVKKHVQLIPALVEAVKQLDAMQIMMTEMNSNFHDMATDINTFFEMKTQVDVIPALTEKIINIEKILQKEERSTAENSAKIDDKLDKIMAKETYSDAVKKSIKPLVGPRLILKPTNEKLNREDVLKEIKGRINENQVDIIGTKPTKNGNSLIIEVKDAANQVKLRQEIATKFDGKYQVREIAILRPRIKIINAVIPLDDCKAPEDVEQYLKSKNDELKEAKLVLSVPKGKTASDQSFDIIMEVNTKTFNYYVEDGNRVKTSWTCCKVIEGIQVKRCMLCLKYGHTKNGCRNKDKGTLCAKCGGSHMAKDCQMAAKCPNCANANTYAKDGLQFDVNHSALSKACPIYKIRYEQLAKQVKFD